MFYNNGYNQNWSTLKKLVWLRGNPATGQIGTDLTVSGTPPLSLPNSIGKPLKAWSVDLLPYQEGSGDPAPDNVRPIHGTDKLNIVTSGSRNFLDPSKETTYSGGLGHRWFYADGIALYAGTTYTFSVSGTNQTIALYAVDKATGRDAAYVPNGNLTFTLSQTTLVYLQAYRGTAILPENKFQLEVGSTASPYEEFAEPATTSITLPQTVYTGTIGSEGGESEDAVYEFDENLPWQTWGVNNQVQGITGFYFYRSNLPTIDFTNINVAVSTNWLPINNRVWGGGAVGYYTNNTNVNPASWYEMVGIENSVAGIADTDTAQQAVDKFKAYLTNNPLQVRFSLVTNVQFPLTTPTIPTPTGTATTWATAEDGTVDSMEVTYVGKA